jgi:AbrB family looped-hinge helix DNA binding protein
MENIIVDSAKVMAKGQITLPKDIREALGVETGDRVTLILRDNQVIIMNAAVYAMQTLQEGMKGEFEKAGLKDDTEVMAAVREARVELEGL